MLFRQLFDPRLAQYAYLIGCQRTKEAIIVDPMRDVDRYIEAAASEGLRLVAAAETHIHADFLSGVRELAERGVLAIASAEGGEEWQSNWLAGSSYLHRLVRDGDTFHVGNIKFEVLHTPGHTPEHVSYVVTDVGGGATAPMGILSGDFVFVGDVGRPDLLETAAGRTGAMEPSARTLFASIGRFRTLPPFLQVWPGHGAGSACGKALGAVPSSTVGYELSFNAALLAASSEESFVRWVLEGQPEPPLYFGRMKRENRDGPAVLGKLPQPRRLRSSKLAELAGATGVALLDTRPWNAYRGGHVPGSFFAPLGGDFNTVAGCYVEAGMAIYLIVDDDRVGDATVDLVHVGLDNVVGYATPEMLTEYSATGGKLARIPEIEAAALGERADAGVFTLDVRRAAEVAELGHIMGSCNIAHTRLLERIVEVPKDRAVVVYCQSGIRSAYACGLLDRQGYKVTNVAGGFGAWVGSGGEAARA